MIKLTEIIAIQNLICCTTFVKWERKQSLKNKQNLLFSRILLYIRHQEI